MKIRLGSRESKLALIQAEIVKYEILKKFPQAEIEIIGMKTTGDKILDRPLREVGGKKLFVKELDKCLLNGECDITVHSLKDIPTAINEKLPIGAYLKREQPYDVLVLPKGKQHLDFNLPIGTSGKRREMQIKNIFPCVSVKPIRGNVPTRLKKLDDGEYGGLILAEAGLVRLGLEERISRRFTIDEIVPAPGQGVIAVQYLKGGNKDIENILKAISHIPTEKCAMAERAFAASLGGDCHSAIGAYARLVNSVPVLKTFVGEV